MEIGASSDRGDSAMCLAGTETRQESVFVTPLLHDSGAWNARGTLPKQRPAGRGTVPLTGTGESGNHTGGVVQDVEEVSSERGGSVMILPQVTVVHTVKGMIKQSCPVTSKLAREKSRLMEIGATGVPTVGAAQDAEEV